MNADQLEQIDRANAISKRIAGLDRVYRRLYCYSSYAPIRTVRDALERERDELLRSVADTLH